MIVWLRSVQELPGSAWAVNGRTAALQRCTTGGICASAVGQHSTAAVAIGWLAIIVLAACRAVQLRSLHDAAGTAVQLTGQLQSCASCTSCSSITHTV
jgi:hypothetical protein